MDGSAKSILGKTCHSIHSSFIPQTPPLRVPSTVVCMQLLFGKYLSKLKEIHLIREVKTTVTFAEISFQMK